MRISGLLGMSGEGSRGTTKIPLSVYSAARAQDPCLLLLSFLPVIFGDHIRIQHHKTSHLLARLQIWYSSRKVGTCRTASQKYSQIFGSRDLSSFLISKFHLADITTRSLKWLWSSSKSARIHVQVQRSLSRNATLRLRRLSRTQQIQVCGWNYNEEPRSYTTSTYSFGLRTSFWERWLQCTKIRAHYSWQDLILSMIISALPMMTLLLT